MRGAWRGECSNFCAVWIYDHQLRRTINYVAAARFSNDLVGSQMKKFMVAATLAALATMPALAKVESPPPPPPAPASNWAGCYVGVNGGIGWNKGNTHYNDPNTTTDPINFIPNVVPSSFIPAPSGTGGTGGLGGGGAGCNWQNQQWVYGLEGDIDGGRIAGSQTNSVTAATATVFGVNPVTGLSGLLGNPTGTAGEALTRLTAEPAVCRCEYVHRGSFRMTGPYARSIRVAGRWFQVSTRTAVHAPWLIVASRPRGIVVRRSYLGRTAPGAVVPGA